MAIFAFSTTTTTKKADRLTLAGLFYASLAFSLRQSQLNHISLPYTVSPSAITQNNRQKRR